jgi:prolyl oligopeptidase
MPRLIESPPHTPVHVVTDVLHGVGIDDPYRWLEQQDSPQTREWIDHQALYARAYLDQIPGRDRIRTRVQELLETETYDSFLRNGERYFFRKRIRGREQGCICMRDGAEGLDQILIDPMERGSGPYVAVRPLRISPDGRLLLYELKEGGERTGRFELLEIATRTRLPDFLPRGYLRGFAFAPDSQSFYYSHEATETEERPFYRSVLRHFLGTDRSRDQEIFHAGEDEKLRLILLSSRRTMGFLVYRFADRRYTDFYIGAMEGASQAIAVLRDADYTFLPQLLPGRILALTDREAPNRRIVQVQPRKGSSPLFFDLVPEADIPIGSWFVSAHHIVVGYQEPIKSRIVIFGDFGKPLRELPSNEDETLRVVASDPENDELLIERESFTSPVKTFRCAPGTGTCLSFAQPHLPSLSTEYRTRRVTYCSSDNTEIPMYLVGREEVLSRDEAPAILTAYGGYGVPMTPQFSVFVHCLLERGCLFCLPQIRGGSELGLAWHHAARRHHRQRAFDDFLSAAQWLTEARRTSPAKLAIFGGSNSGLLVGAALTQRPELFRVVICMVPLLDMLRYHLFDRAYVWKEEYGTADDQEDFAALRAYSPYHHVRDGVAYPATMIVSGDADQNCNALHARKMTARLQAASSSGHPILLHYNPMRGHAPVLPLSDRVEALSDRLAFICDHLQLPE